MKKQIAVAIVGIVFSMANAFVSMAHDGRDRRKYDLIAQVSMIR